MRGDELNIISLSIHINGRVMVRDNKGQFVKGHGAIGGGRKPRAAEQEIKTALRNVLPDDVVVNKLAEQVRNGEDWAITLWMAYLYGKPVQKEEITGKDGGALVIKVKLPDVK